MHHRLLQYIHDRELFNLTDTILIAVSGGIDSMCLLHTMQQAGFKIAVAHCNFKLRGEESDADAKFVSQYCQDHRIKCHIKSIDTENHAREQKISTQEAARDLRYQWFEELRKTHQYHVVATAHNKNDSVETVLINLARGTGLKGLTGIKPKINHIVRPLLFARRDEIEEYVKKEKIAFREDSTNVQEKYTRNQIRHTIIPLFQKINPRFTKHVEKSTAILNDIANYLDQDIDQFKASFLHQSGDMISIQLEPFASSPFWMKHAILNQYGFNTENVEKICQAMTGQKTGSRFLSRYFELIVDREALLLRSIRPADHQQCYLNLDDRFVHDPISLQWEILDDKPEITSSIQRNTVYIDMDKLSFPLQLRKWKQGDHFYPLGMEKPKKLSDFFIDEKFSRFEKENVWLLTTQANDIVWIVNYRLDNRFKITNHTQKTLKMEYL